ncbi:MAG: G8 domain-containing protein [Gemmatimonadales bacterium]
MVRSSAVRHAVLLLTLTGGCITEREHLEPPPGSPPGALRWSDPSIWPDNRVPAVGESVTIPADRVVVLDLSPPALRSLTIDGQLHFDRQDLSVTADWIVVRGGLQVGTPDAPFTHRAVITLTGADTEDVQGMGGKVLAVLSGTLDLHGELRTTWTKLSTTAEPGVTQISLAGTVDWRAGDRIVLASTDFDPFQAEEVVVTAVQGNTVTFQPALRFRHWGVVQQIEGRAVDQRGEVGLLSRNIVIQGDSTSQTTGSGGQVVVNAGAEARVQGVEFTRMGQKGKLARYPMHWHMAGSVEGQYFRNNSVWKTFNRCLTIHGTQDLQVTRNVCYDNLGHAFFLEDGAETGNVLEDNLGLVTRRPEVADRVLPSDNDPATFWITNPDNVFRRNVAAGSRGFGFWFALPVSPTGLSSGHPAVPRQTALGEFSDNVAHSNRNTGLNVDHGPRPDGTIETAHHTARETPGNTSSAVVQTVFRNFIGYKHSGRAVWLRGTGHKLVGAVLSDNHIGATFASSESFLESALVVGRTDNSATAFTANFPVRGYEFYDGRVGADRVTFVNFMPSGSNYMSALGYNRANGFPVNPRNFGTQLSFVNANRLYFENPRADKDGDKASAMLDTDGSLTGVAGQTVVSRADVMVTPACRLDATWNAHVCGGRYVNIRVRSADQAAVAPLDLVRDDGATTGYVGVPGQAYNVSATVPASRSYRVVYRTALPTKPQFYVNGLVQGDWVRLTLPYQGTGIKVYRDYSTTATIPAAATLAELDASSGDRYFHDVGAGMLHLKAMARQGRDWATLFVTP